jgi:predicted RNA-binding protein associated with RNAse of E/G family
MDIDLKAKLTNPFTPGQPVLVRELWDGKVWSARPEIIVQDTPELLAIYKTRGTRWKQSRSPEGTKLRGQSRKAGRWHLWDVAWNFEGNLRLNIPGSHYSVLAFWNDGHQSLKNWYINLEYPLTRTERGFDYTDMILDLIVAPDLKNWYWKDEDEFQEAIDLGLISTQEAKFFRTEGEKVLKLLQSGNSIFNNWERWQPDPSWEVPVLPDGWDII